MSQPLAIVTGASSGIGAAIARALAARGWRTALLARRAELLESLAHELTPLAPSAAFPVDLDDLDSIEPTIERVTRALGPPRALVNNAGFGLYKPFLDHSIAEHERLMRVNYFAPLRLIRATVPHLLAREPDHDGARGSVVNISSMSVKMGPWGHSGYTAAKAALRTLTHTLDAEHAPRGVRFSAVFPGIVDTAYFHAGDYPSLLRRVRRHVIAPGVVAGAVVRLLDRPRLETCVPGHYRALDLIAAVSPALAHRIVARQSRPPAGDSRA